MQQGASKANARGFTFSKIFVEAIHLPDSGLHGLFLGHHGLSPDVECILRSRWHRHG